MQSRKSKRRPPSLSVRPDRTRRFGPIARAFAWIRLDYFCLVAAAALQAPAAFAGDWAAHQQKMATLNAKLSALEGDVRHLIQAKSEMEDASEARAVVDEISQKHKELQKVAKEREAELEHIRFKHPEKGELKEREYLRYQVKSLEELESEPGLEGKLDRIKRLVEIKYRVEPKGKEDRSDPGLARDPASNAAPERPVLRK